MWHVGTLALWQWEMLREWLSPFGTVLRLQRRRPATHSTHTARRLHTVHTQAACTLHARCMHTAYISGYAEETALSVACKAGFREVCTLLVGRGARLHNENEDESPAEVGRRPPTRHVRRAVTHTRQLCVRWGVTPRPWRGRCSRSRATLSFWPSSRCSRSSATARPNMSACGERASRAVSILLAAGLEAAPICAPEVTAEMPVFACRRRAHGGGWRGRRRRK